MSKDEMYAPVAPVDHGVFSSAGSVAVGTAGGALSAVGKTMLWCIGGGALLGALALMGWIPIGSLFAGEAAGAAWGAVAKLFGGALLGGGIGGLVSLVAAPVAGVVGAGKGAVRSSERVSMEKGAARSMEMQLAAYQSMAASNDNKYNLPQQGSAMNPACSKLDAGSINRAGTIADRQLALGAGA